MKLPVSKTNAPVWRDVIVKAELPAQLKPLEELARNLWWVWNSEAKALFRDLNPDLWRSTGENPVMVLQQLKSDRIDEILADKGLMDRIAHVYSKLREYLAKRRIAPQFNIISDEQLFRALFITSALLFI